MATGRPTKYNPAFCDLVIKMMKKGHSKLSVAGQIGISRDTLYEWCKKYPEFSDTIKVGEMKSYAYWEDLGMRGMMGKVKGFRPSLWIFTMKARFGWSDNSPLKAIEDDLDKLEHELEQKEKTNKKPPTMAEIVEKYKDYIPTTLVS